MKRVIPFLAILGMCAIGTIDLHAATLVVSEATDAALRNAVANAAPGDFITFDPALFVNGPVDISLNGAILIEKDLTIAGPVGKGLSIKGGQKEIFVIGAPSQNCHVLLRNMKLWDGATQGKNGEMQCTGGGGGAALGGAIYVNFAILICQNVVFEKNSAIGGDGALSGLANAVNGGRGGNACNDYLIYQTSAGEYVRGNNLGGLGGDVNSIVHTGSPGGYACGGGGGVGERLFQNNAASGGAGGWAGGGGGGGGGGSTYKTGGAGGEFGGNGGAGDLSSHGGGGGGAGLGGAIFVDSNGGLILENCVFRGNLAKGGMPGLRGTSGQGKGGAIFAKPNTLLNLYNVSFQDNMASHATGSGFVSGFLSDTCDLYGTGSLASPNPLMKMVVTTALDEFDDLYYGTGLSLREALSQIGSGGEIEISESILPATFTINSVSRQFVIEKNVKIKVPSSKPFVVDGNGGRAFFVKSGHLFLENMKIVNGVAKGGDGGDGGLGGGGAAGMGGSVFINTNAVLSAINVQFENSTVQGGKGGNADFLTSYGGGGGGIWGDGASEKNGAYGGSGWPLSDWIAYPDMIIQYVNGGDGGGGAGFIHCYGGNGGFGGGGGSTVLAVWGKGGFGGGSGGVFDRSFGRTVPGAFGGGGYFDGGGGAGLGGALFVRTGGSLFLDRCMMTNNFAGGGAPGDGLPDFANPGLGKGGAIFVMDGATAKMRDCSFAGNKASNSTKGEGFAYYMLSDTPDVYGVIHDLSDGDIGAFPSADATPTPTPIGGETGEPTPTVTPTPYATPTPEIQETPVPQPASIRYEFSGASADENNVTLQGAGFGAYPQADVSFGYLPTDNAFEGATDGQGVIVKADPGEGVMIFGSRIDDNRSALIRCSVRTNLPNAEVTIASIGSAPGRFIAVNYPEDESYFNGRYMRLQTFCVPPSIGIQPLIQIVNTNPTETLTAYIDNLEVHFIDPYKYYSGAFLDGDEIDPPADKISIPSSQAAGFNYNPYPEIPRDFRAVANPDSNTIIDLFWSVFGSQLGVIYLQRSTTGQENDWSQLAIFPAIEIPDFSYSDFDLSPNTLYYYRLFVQNSISRYGAYSETISVHTNP